MGTEAGDLKPSSAGGPAAAKRPKTGGRVKKPLDQLLAEARVRDELAGMRDDTVLPEELAAIYLCVSVAELAELRKPPKAAPSAKGGGEAKPARLKMIKPIREGAVGQNQKVVYKLAALREFLASNTVESSFEAAVNSGMYGFVAMRAPFFSQPEKRSDRGRVIIVAPAWSRLDPERAGRLKDALDGKLRVVWLTPAEAASSRWASVSSHNAFAKPWLAALKTEAQAVKAAVEGTEIACVAMEKPSGRQPA
ncbi:MAG: hypothetical protein M3N02_02755 [Pseudomonadota bacterium]|nr:hypothetical protein [Pseudomonadota bacterium]